MIDLPLGQSLREAFWSELTEVARDDDRLMVLDADVANATQATLFETRWPDRFLQMGIAELNMTGVAAGLATMGWKPVINGFACFAISRALDSIRVLVAQPGLDVKIIGSHSGLMVGAAGKTHQDVEDISIMRAMPGMTVIAPADETEARQVARASVSNPGPWYVRLTRNPSPLVFSADYQFQLGRAVVLRPGKDVTIISTGVQSARVLAAATLLEQRGISALVLHVPTVKPLDVEGVMNAAAKTGVVVTSEDHSVIGGLGGAVAEALSSKYPVRIERLGIDDVFGQPGSDEDLANRYGLSPAATAAAVETLLRVIPC